MGKWSFLKREYFLDQARTLRTCIVVSKLTGKRHQQTSKHLKMYKTVYWTVIGNGCKHQDAITQSRAANSRNLSWNKNSKNFAKKWKKNCPCVIRLADEGNRFPLFRPQRIDTPVHLMSRQTNWAAEVNVVRTLAAFIPKQMLPSLEVLIWERGTIGGSEG